MFAYPIDQKDVRFSFQSFKKIFLWCDRWNWYRPYSPIRCWRDCRHYCERKYYMIVESLPSCFIAIFFFIEIHSSLLIEKKGKEREIFFSKWWSCEMIRKTFQECKLIANKLGCVYFFFSITNLSSTNLSKCWISKAFSIEKQFELNYKSHRQYWLIVARCI